MALRNSDKFSTHLIIRADADGTGKELLQTALCPIFKAADKPADNSVYSYLFNANTRKVEFWDGAAWVGMNRLDIDGEILNCWYDPTLPSFADTIGATSGSGSDPNATALVSLSGMPALSTTLGTFTGTTISDNTTIKNALQQLELAVEAAVDARVDDLIVLTGVAANAQDLGTFLGTTIADNLTIKAAFQALETAVEANQTRLDDLDSLVGVGTGQTDLGTFTGITIADNSTIKQALQDLETAVEAGITFTQPFVIADWVAVADYFTLDIPKATHLIGKPDVKVYETVGGNSVEVIPHAVLINNATEDIQIQIAGTNPQFDGKVEIF